MRRGLCIFKVAKAQCFYKGPVLLNRVEHQQEGLFLLFCTLFRVALFLLARLLVVHRTEYRESLLTMQRRLLPRVASNNMFHPGAPTRSPQATGGPVWMVWNRFC